MHSTAGEIELLLNALDQAYDHSAWHGQNLKGALRGVKAAQAGWRPAPGRHNVWELAVHAAYWKYVVTRRIVGLERGSFPLEGSNFFARPEGEPEERTWKAERILLDDCHRRLRETVAALDPKRLGELANKRTLRETILGAALHDTYHTGQIQLLKKLYEQAA